MLLLSFAAGFVCEAVRIPIFQFLQIELSDGVHTDPKFIAELREIPENIPCFQQKSLDIKLMAVKHGLLDNFLAFSGLSVKPHNGL